MSYFFLNYTFAYRYSYKLSEFLIKTISSIAVYISLARNRGSLYTYFQLVLSQAMLDSSKLGLISKIFFPKNAKRLLWCHWSEPRYTGSTATMWSSRLYCSCRLAGSSDYPRTSLHLCLERSYLRPMPRTYLQDEATGGDIAQSSHREPSAPVNCYFFASLKSYPTCLMCFEGISPSNYIFPS